jgi:hypothetical protein
MKNETNENERRIPRTFGERIGIGMLLATTSALNTVNKFLSSSGVVSEEWRISNEVSQKMVNLDRYPGNLKEYNEIIGEEHEVIPVRPYFAVGLERLDSDYLLVRNWERTRFIHSLLEKGLCGFVHFDYNNYSGIPVRRASGRK